MGRLERTDWAPVFTGPELQAAIRRLRTLGIPQPEISKALGIRTLYFQRAARGYPIPKSVWIRLTNLLLGNTHKPGSRLYHHSRADFLKLEKLFKKHRVMDQIVRVKRS